MINSIERAQREICKKYGAVYCAALSDMKVGVSLNVRSGALPINGLRHPPENDSTGWYIWAGEDLSNDADFFKPLHVTHLPDWCPEVEKYLGLPPVWRFLIAGEYEDVWFDDSLLNI
ncbi:hypothetical protein D3C84_667820 [compost metagenome]